MLQIQFSSMVREKRQPQSNGWILALARQVLSLIGNHTQAARTQLQEAFGVVDQMDAYLSQVAIGLAPEPFGLAHIYNRRPYQNPDQLRAGLSNAVQRGWLKQVREGVYQATDKSHQYYGQLGEEIDRVYLALQTLPESQLKTLDSLLGKIITAIETEACFSYTPALELECQLSRSGKLLLQKVCSKLAQLVAYHEDAYMNAWMAQEVNGYVWEAFSQIYKGQARSAHELARELGALRHYDAAVYQLALDELEARGWIYLRNRKYEPTNDGLKIVSQVARTMNRCFYAPVKTLSNDEHMQFQELMEQLAEKLQATTNVSRKSLKAQIKNRQRAKRSAAPWSWAYMR